MDHRSDSRHRLFPGTVCETVLANHSFFSGSIEDPIYQMERTTEKNKKTLESKKRKAYQRKTENKNHPPQTPADKRNSRSTTGSF